MTPAHESSAPVGAPASSDSAGYPACRHCGLPVPRSRLHGEGRDFCCDGCQTVYAVIHGEGLERYYEIRDRVGASGRPARATGAGYEHFDDPRFMELYCRGTREGLLAVDLYLEGVHCSACLWLVERTAVLVAGVAAVTLDLARSVAHVVFDPARVKLSDIARKLDGLGYPPHPRRTSSRELQRHSEDRALLARIGVAGAAAGNVMLAAVALYGGSFGGIASEHEQLFRWVSLAVATPAVLWAGNLFFRGAWSALRARAWHMDQPIALGVLVGYSSGFVNTLRGHGDLYFDSVTTLVFLLLIGRWLQRRQQRRAADAAELMSALAPSSARVVEGAAVRSVPVDAVVPGALVEVRSGETFPVDGIVKEGRSRVERALLTGESMPERVGPGDRVYAGCVNLSELIRIRATAAGAATRVGQLVERMEEAARRRAPVVRLADSIAGWFVMVVLALATLSFVLWLSLDPREAVDNTVALLVVACPCALGMATPLAISVALGRAARRGILIKGGDALEQLAHPSLIVFDKTGTLTSGKLELVEWLGDPALKPLVRAAEARSSHPIARAFLDALPEVPVELEAVEERPGAGLRVRHAGRTVLVGAPAFVARDAGPLAPWVEQAIAQAGRAARSPVLVAVGREVRAVAAFGDPLRHDARRSLLQLRELGCELALLSGDHPDVVAAVVRELGVELSHAEGGVSPEAKLAFVQRARSRNGVVMVGDGANDAAAMAAATVGVAVQGSAEASLAAADVFATRGGVAPVTELVLGARGTLRIIRRSVVFSLAYNLAGVSLALAGFIDPLVAALLMPLSSLTVVASSVRARTFAAGPRAQPGPVREPRATPARVLGPC